MPSVLSPVLPPILSVVTPTLGRFSATWLEALLAIQGDVQFVLVYPPGTIPHAGDDPRLKLLTSPYRGEMMQRLVGLLNADGRYIIALDDDDYLHPEVVNLTLEYFQRFPQSWVLRLYQDRIPAEHRAAMTAPWADLPVVADLPVLTHRTEADLGLIEVPIAPLTKRFDRRYLLWPWRTRRDDQGRHIENFNNKVWDSQKVQPVLPVLLQTTTLLGLLTWIPRSGFDRLLGLFLQAHWFEADRAIGHWMPAPGQVRFNLVAPELKPPRFHAASDWLLVRQFPQYGYLWNLWINKLSYVPKLTVKVLLGRVRR